MIIKRLSRTYTLDHDEDPRLFTKGMAIFSANSGLKYANFWVSKTQKWTRFVTNVTNITEGHAV